jgi:2-polyprenyl-3-methyl-5-hydroxy-6-metoxy-1,4-benzoquinol methylase
MAMGQKTIGVLIVAYNAEVTLSSVLDRIPEHFRHRITRILVSDDASQDSTYVVGTSYAALNPESPLTVIRQPKNLGYGGNQKACYRWAIEHDLDIVVLLHGDGQYAPELLPQIVAPLDEGTADMVMGSRMMAKREARRGGMPLYKFVGNIILTRAQNALMGVHLSEWHSGYRAFSVRALHSVPFGGNSDGFDFDSQIIIQFIDAQKRIAEIPIPTYYGDEISHVNGMRYAAQVVGHVLRYRMGRMGFGRTPAVAPGAASGPVTGDLYEEKFDANSSHQRLLASFAGRAPGTVLDLGCATGLVGGQLRDWGHQVTGVDLLANPIAARRLDRFVVADLEEGVPEELGQFDAVLAADVLEHLPRPEDFLTELHATVRPGGRVVACIPNFGHWYPRLRVLAGRFDYDRRGILDAGHLRFFTRRSFLRLARGAGWQAHIIDATGVPFEVVGRGPGGEAHQSRLGRWVTRVLGPVDRVMVRLWPTLFAYQFIFELTAEDS